MRRLRIVLQESVVNESHDFCKASSTIKHDCLCYSKLCPTRALPLYALQHFTAVLTSIQYYLPLLVGHVAGCNQPQALVLLNAVNAIAVEIALWCKAGLCTVVTVCMFSMLS